MFVDAGAGAGVTEQGDVRWRAGKNVGAVLRALPAGVNRIVLCGADPGGGSAEGFRSWAIPPRGLPPGWEHGRHYLNRAERSPVLHYRREKISVEVIRAGSFFGSDWSRAATPAATGAAYAELAATLGALFDGLPILTSPATTGRKAWQRSIPHGVTYPVLPAELGDLIRATSGQGRIEFPAAGRPIDQLVLLDGRFMYAALCWGLPTGPVVHDQGDEYLGQVRARYRVDFTVPTDWSHVGLLPVMGDAGAWTYPATGRHQSWADGAEIGVALAHGWPLKILERLYWPEPAGDPLKVWSEKLQAARAAASEPVAAALRAILLHGLGAFYGRPHWITRSEPAATARPPAGASSPRLEGDQLVWEEPEPAAWPELAHPEWPAAVWARCRARLLDGPAGARGARSGALHVPPAELVAFLTDGIYLTRDPGWPDDGKAGRFRHKGAWPVNGPAPASIPELKRITQGGDER